jgi:hypothetical protein
MPLSPTRSPANDDERGEFEELAEEAGDAGVAKQDAGEGGRSPAAGTAPGARGKSQRSSIRRREMGRWPMESELGASRLHGGPASFDRAASMAAPRAPTGLPPWLTARPR